MCWCCCFLSFVIYLFKLGLTFFSFLHFCSHKAIAATHLTRVGRAEDVAEMALFLVSDKAEFITGANMVKGKKGNGILSANLFFFFFLMHRWWMEDIPLQRLRIWLPILGEPIHNKNVVFYSFFFFFFFLLPRICSKERGSAGGK